jgi:hypothetical protein
MSFSLCAVIAEGRLGKEKQPGPAKLGRGNASCNARADRVLRLHSCRALSPQPRQQAYHNGTVEPKQRKHANFSFYP